MPSSCNLLRQRLSIVITVFNCDNLVDRCLTSLSACFEGRLPETVVVDNAGLDSTKNLIARHDVRYERMSNDAGFAGANNAGFRLCTKDYICLVNSDTVFHENPFAPLINFMDNHPEAMVAQGTVVLENGIPDEDGKLDTCGASITSIGRITNPADKKSPSDPDFSFPRKVYYAYGALFLIRHDAVQYTNGFLFRDEFYAYYEETDFCHRTWLGGHEVWYVPTPIVGHAHTATFKKQYSTDRLSIFLTGNRRSSFLTCLGPKLIVQMLLPSELAFSLFCLNILLHGRIAGLTIFVRSWLQTFRALPRTLRLRRMIQKNRKLGDSEFVRMLCMRSSFGDFIQACRGRL